MDSISKMYLGRHPRVIQLTVSQEEQWGGDSAVYEFFIATGNYCKRAQLLYTAVSQFREHLEIANDFMTQFTQCHAAIHAMSYMFKYGTFCTKNRRFYRLLSEPWSLTKSLNERTEFLTMGSALVRAIIKHRPLILNMMDPCWWLMVRSALRGEAGTSESFILEGFDLLAMPGLVKENSSYYRELCMETYDTFFSNKCSTKSLGGPAKKFSY